ncbi:MAG: hypothetical protein SGARI_000802, partial [Bacillariaceae sp.]
FVAERNLYDKTSKLLDHLESWSSNAPTLPQRILELWVNLYEHDYIDLHDVNAIMEWLNTLNGIGYSFPRVDETRLASTSSHVLSQPTLDGQPYRAYPYFNGKANLLDDSWKSKPDWVERPSNAVIKLILMTMDEWPLVRSWVLYHGSLLGFDKLYIIDSSTDSRCISFLRYARDILGANVLFKDANLNKLEGVMSKIASNIAQSADFILKVDTDEYLVAYDNRTQQLTPAAVGEYVSGFSQNAQHPLRQFDGHSRVGYLQLSIPRKDVCEADIYSTPDKFPLGKVSDIRNHWFKARTIMD